MAMKDNYHKRRVLSLKVRCPHKTEGCEWQGELRSLEQHLNTYSSAGECRYLLSLFFIAAKDPEREYDFVERPPEEFFCLVSFTVLLEPYQTQCCGNHLSQEAYQRLQGQPCPVCREENLAAMKDKFHKRRVLYLKVRCPHKAEGCEWQGELGSLEQHLNTNSSAGECRYVDVDCPYACGERVQRRSLEEHKSQRCPLRPFTCQYCNHKATHLKVTKEHWSVCEKYPLPCPNECGEEEIEQKNLKGHLEQTCPLEVIQCDFSYAGCGTQLQRRLMSAFGEIVEYRLSGVHSTLFDIDEFGVIRNLRSFDAEVDLQQLDLLVTAYDGGGRNSSTLVHVFITDVNDFWPEFEEATYSANISEAATGAGLNLLTVHAMDNDVSDSYNKVTYSLSADLDCAKLFAINSTSGGACVCGFENTTRL